MHLLKKYLLSTKNVQTVSSKLHGFIFIGLSGRSSSESSGVQVVELGRSESFNWPGDSVGSLKSGLDLWSLLHNFISRFSSLDFISDKRDSDTGTSSNSACGNIVDESVLLSLELISRFHI